MEEVKISTDKPEKYQFVRGTSIENVEYLLKTGFMRMGEAPYSEPDTFYLCAKHDFPRTHLFSKGFKAKDEEDTLSVTGDFAKMHAYQDYLTSKFEKMVGFVEYEDVTFRTFYDQFSSELKEAKISSQMVQKEFFEAIKRKGVNIYFNDLLLNYDLYPDPVSEYYEDNNALLLKSKEPVSINTIIAIEPLGKIERMILDDIL